LVKQLTEALMSAETDSMFNAAFAEASYPTP